MRVAAIDCGTNSLRLLILEQARDGRIVELGRHLELVRLGQGVDATGEFAPEALARTFAALDGYAARLAELGVDSVRFVATSAARDAGNAEALRTGVEARLGIIPDILTGAEEAALTYAGARAGVRHAQPPVLVTDVGGGSTELVVGADTERIEEAVSLDIGSVRLRERFLHNDPPTSSEWSAAAKYADDLLASGPDLSRVHTWIGVGGTATTLGALHLGLRRYDRDRVHGLRIPRHALAALTQRLRRTPSAELFSELLPPLRAEVIAAGALVCHRISTRLSVDTLTVSENDILDGVAHRLLTDAGPVA